MANTFENSIHVQDELQMRLDANRGLVRFANRKFEGDVKRKGTVVTVEELPLQAWVNATDTKNDISLLDAVATPYDITVAQGKEIGRSVASIEEIRAAFDIKGGLFEAIASGLAQLHEQHFLTQLAADAGNTVATAVLTKSTVGDIIEDMAVALSEDNVPANGRIMALPPRAASLLRRSGIYVYTSEGLNTLKEGEVDRFAGFMLVETTLGPANTMIGFVDGLSHFIDQFSTIEVNKRERRAGYALIGESYYQAKTVGGLTNSIVKHVYTLS